MLWKPRQRCRLRRPDPPLHTSSVQPAASTDTGSASPSRSHLPWGHRRKASATALPSALASSLVCLLLCWLPGTAAVVTTAQAVAATVQHGTLPIRPGTREAYVTLLYGEAFLLGVRVLGQSLRETGTTRELVVLCAGELSMDSEDTLVNEGWEVRHVGVVQNPGTWTAKAQTGFPPRFWAVYTKLMVFNLTEYSTVVYLDADALVVRNMDEVFGCAGFCAALRHSERLNSGVMVVQPSAAVFDDMLSKIGRLPSYTGGDQGFLNSYFSGFANAPVFDGNEDHRGSDQRYMRLPTRYNADIGLYVINSNRWSIPASEIRVVHFTLGNFKPWIWYTSWIINQVPQWVAFRKRLPATPRGLRNGDSTLDVAARNLLLPLPPLLAALLVYTILWGAGMGASIQHAGRWALARAVGGQAQHIQVPASPRNTHGGMAHMGLQRTGSMPPACFALPRRFQAVCVGAGFLALLCGAGLGALLVPTNIRPTYGWFLFTEWVLFTFTTLYGVFLWLAYHAGRGSEGSPAAQRGPPGKIAAGHRYAQPWPPTLMWMTVGIAALAVTPWTADILGVSGLVGRVLLTAGSVVVVTVLWSQLFVHLGILWYVAGKGETLYR